MPHIVYEGAADLASVHQAFQPDSLEQEGWIIKITRAFLADDGRSILFESIAVRSNFSQSFYVVAECKRNQVTIRVDPRTNVEKNDGVKRAVSLASSIVLARNPDLRPLRTNLPQHIYEPHQSQ